MRGGLFMDINLFSKDVDLSDVMRDHLEKQLSKVKKMVNDDKIISYDVRVNKDRAFYKVEVTIHLPGVLIRVEEKGSDFYNVVDGLVDTLERRLRKYMKIPLDMITLMVTSIVIGVGVDDTIHYNIRFRKNLKDCGDVDRAVEITHIETGRPIMHTTISIVGGLLFLLLSSFLGIAYFGLLICFTLLFTMIGTLVLLPAVLSLTEKIRAGVKP